MNSFTSLTRFSLMGTIVYCASGCSEPTVSTKPNPMSGAPAPTVRTNASQASSAPQPAWTPFEPEWKEFTSAEGRFSVLMQGTPEQKQSVLSTVLEQVNLVSYDLMLNDPKTGRSVGFFTISYADYPAGSTKAINADEFLERTWQDSFRRADNTLLSKNKINLDNYPGLAFQYRGKGEGEGATLVTGRNFLVNDRVYQLAAIMTKKRFDRGSATIFLDSFKLIKPE